MEPSPEIPVAAKEQPVTTEQVAGTIMPQPPTQVNDFTTFVKTNAKTIGVVIIIIILASAYFHQTQTANLLKQQNQQLAHPGANAQAQASQLRDQVGQLIELPTNELPTVATVADVSKLQNQPFFANAKNGDKVLMFPKAKEAVLYRPTSRKIVQVAPLNPGSTAATAGNSTGSSFTSNSSTAP